MAKPRVSSAAELQDKSKFDHIEISVQIEEDEPLNCECVDVSSGVVMVIKVSSDSILHGKVQSGDYLLSINDKIFKNRIDMFKIASRAFPHMKLIIAREKSQPSSTPPQAAPAAAATTMKLKEPAESSEKSSSESEAPQTSSSSSTKTQIDPRKVAECKGFTIRPDREYIIARAKTTNSGKPLGLGIMRVAKDNSILVSSVQPNSVSSEIFKAGDRFLAINDTNITDVQICRKLILETKGDFETLIERPPTGLQAYGIEKAPNPSSHGPLKSSYTQPSKSDPEQQLGDPLQGYEAAPGDIQGILNRQLPILMKAFGVGSQRSSQRERVLKESDRLKIEHEVHEQHIESDVPHGSFLRKPPKR